MIVEELRKSILLAAFKGNLSDKFDSDTDLNTTISEIEKEKKVYLSVHKIKKTKLFDVKEQDEPFKIPTHWKWVRWGNLSNSIQYGVNAGALAKGNVKLVRISDIVDNKIAWNTVPYSNINESEINQYILNENDILFARTGGTVGKSVIVKNIPTDEKYVFAGYLIRSNYSNQVNYKYLKYFMESPLYWSQLKNGTIGSAQPNCNGQTLSKMIVPLPPIEEQQRIVDKIELLFAKLQEIKPIEEELKFLKDSFSNDMITSILNDAYIGKLTNQNTSVWNSNKLIDCCKEIVTGNSISESIKKSKYTNIKDGYNYIATKDLEFNHSFNYDNGIKIPFDEKGFKYARENDILICIEGGSAGKKIGILNETVCYGNKLCRFSTNQNILPKFLYYYLQSPIFLKNFNSNLSGIIGGVSINKIKNIELKYPSIEEQQRIVEKIEQLLPLCNDIEKIISE